MIGTSHYESHYGQPEMVAQRSNSFLKRESALYERFLDTRVCNDVRDELGYQGHMVNEILSSILHQILTLLH
jgi:hypothetical protein